jgi:polyhydroxybutyrate depolymerase
MTYAAGCELADVVLAIAPVSGGTRQLPPCHPARPISILDVHGTSDQIVSYRGRGADHDGRVRDVMDGWARREGCRARPRARRIDRFVVRLEWPRCRGGVRVAHLRIEGGRHAWPPLGGPAGIGIDGAEEIWRFFAALPPRA